MQLTFAVISQIRLGKLGLIIEQFSSRFPPDHASTHWGLVAPPPNRESPCRSSICGGFPIYVDGGVDEFSIKIFKPGSDFILEQWVKRLLLGCIPIHTSISNPIKPVLSIIHYLYSKVARGIVVE